LNGYRNQAWAQILLYFAPSVSLAISACVLWLRAQLDDYLQSKLQEQKEKRQLKKFDKAERIFLAILADDNASTQSKEKARKALTKLNDLRTEQALAIAKQNP
jgi:hypothetical protein